MSRKLSPGLAAALALGATVSPELQAAADEHDSAATAAAAETKAAPVVVVTSATTAAPAVTEAAAVVAAPAATETPVAATNVSAETTATLAAADTSGQNALVAHLKDEATAARNALTALTLKHTQVEASLASIQGDVTLLLPVVQESAKRLCVALNVDPVGIDGMTAAQLATYFGKLDGQFKSKFKVGAQADTGGRVEEPARTTAASNDSATDIQAARVRAATVGKK